MKNLIGFIAIVSFFTSCSNKGEDKTSDTENTTNGSAVYTFQKEFTTLNWTAFKTMDRTPVGGTFDEFDVKPGKDQGSVTEILQNLAFNIKVASSNSGNPDRDPKILTYFYGKLMGTSNITGVITGVEGNDSAGTARIAVIINEISNLVQANYVVSGNKVTLKASLNLSAWKADSAIESLNDACSELHKGADGTSKLWPDVDVVVESTLKASLAN